MIISINNPVGATWIFLLIFISALLLSLRRQQDRAWFPLYLTHELKGLAVLLVVFSHLGYFLVTDHRFLFPVSIMAGVGVNLFLFLSGYGLTIGSLRQEKTVWQFYRSRLAKIMLPFWLVLIAYLALDFFVLKISYPWPVIFKSAVGFFPKADLYHDINSPLWYMTLILFYYLVFPLLFFRRWPWLSALGIYLAGYLVVKIQPELLSGVMRLYQVHIMAFPLGVLLGWIFYEPYRLAALLPDKFEAYLDRISRPRWLHDLIQYLKQPNFLHRWAKGIKAPLYYLLLAVLAVVIGYTAYHSGVGEGANKEQLISLTTMLAFILFFNLKKLDIKLLSLFGLYSYEIYLLHWPLVYRYDFFYRFLPAWLATAIYLIVCLGLAWAVKRISDSILSLLPKKSK